MLKSRKAFLTLAVLSAMSLMAAEDTIIYVTTFDDEDGTNDAKCSLREALTAASTNRAYGGCAKGNTDRVQTDIIQLEAGTYSLNAELQPTSSVIIRGKEPVDYSKPNVISNSYPAQTKIQTIINGQNTHRIFNTTNLNRPSLSLRNIELRNGKSSTNGGALLLGGETDLYNVNITSSSALRGGAIFLNDSDSSLSYSVGWVSGNTAQQGAVIAMSCLDNLVFTRRKIDLSRMSITENGNTASNSLFSFCGEPTAQLQANTISSNVLNNTQGQIFQFSDRLTDGGQINLSPNSILKLDSNTIIANTARSVLWYGNTGAKALNHNVIGFNQAKACIYSHGDVSQVESAGIELLANAIPLSNPSIDCDLPAKASENAQKNSLDVSQLSINDLFSTSLPVNDENTNFHPVFFPKINSSGTDLVDFGTDGCSLLDQRGINRIGLDSLNSLDATPNTCDIGAIETLKLTVSNLSKANESLVQIKKSTENRIKAFEDAIADPETKEEVIDYYNKELTDQKAFLNELNNLNQYRPILFDPFKLNLPDEFVSPDGKVRKIEHLNVDNYDVKVEVVGVGKLDIDKTFLGKFDDRLKCEWKPQLKQIVMYRTDGRITPSGDSEFCTYTLTSKSDSKKTSSAYLIGNFINIVPTVPERVEYTINPKKSTQISVNLLAEASDAGDGNRNAINPQNKKEFYHNANGDEVSIYFARVPTPVSIIADRVEPCANDRFKKCYGGNIRVQLNNNLDVFSYDLKYSVLDADGASSGEGTLAVLNTETGPGSSRTSGGGSLGGFGLLGLIGLSWLRMRKSKPH